MGYNSQTLSYRKFYSHMIIIYNIIIYHYEKCLL
jgi:hypothetical protein